jgi:hypothetical protein
VAIGSTRGSGCHRQTKTSSDVAHHLAGSMEKADARERSDDHTARKVDGKGCRGAQVGKPIFVVRKGNPTPVPTELSPSLEDVQTHQQYSTSLLFALIPSVGAPSVSVFSGSCVYSETPTNRPNPECWMLPRRLPSSIFPPHQHHAGRILAARCRGKNDDTKTTTSTAWSRSGWR